LLLHLISSLGELLPNLGGDNSLLLKVQVSERVIFNLQRLKLLIEALCIKYQGPRLSSVVLSLFGFGCFPWFFHPNFESFDILVQISISIKHSRPEQGFVDWFLFGILILCFALGFGPLFFL
jgi:hypothetical protein